MRFVHVTPTFPCYPHSPSWDPMLAMIGRQKAQGLDPLVIIPASKHLPETFGGAATLTRGTPKEIILNYTRVFAVAPENILEQTLYRFDDIDPAAMLLHKLELELFDSSFSSAIGAILGLARFSLWGLPGEKCVVRFWGKIMEKTFRRTQDSFDFAVKYDLPSAQHTKRTLLIYNDLGQRLEIVEDEMAKRRTLAGNTGAVKTEKEVLVL